MPPSLKEYSKAEQRLKESLWLRCNGLPLHDYPGRQADLRTIRAYHAAYGVPPEGLFKRLWWWFWRSRAKEKTRTTERPGGSGRGREGRGFPATPVPPKAKLEKGTA